MEGTVLLLCLSVSTLSCFYLFRNILFDHSSQLLILQVFGELSKGWSTWLALLVFSQLAFGKYSWQIATVLIAALFQSLLVSPDILQDFVRATFLTWDIVHVLNLAAALLSMSFLILFPLGTDCLPHESSTAGVSYLDMMWDRSLEGKERKQIPMRVYYPSILPDNKNVRTFDTTAHRSLFQKLTGLPKFMTSHFNFYPTKAAIAAIEARGKPTEYRQVARDMYQYPVMIVSQDYNGLNIDALHLLCESLSIDGWIVVSVKHTNQDCRAVTPFFPVIDKLEATELKPELSPEDAHFHMQNQRTEQHVMEISRVLDILLSIQYGQFDTESSVETVESQLFKGRLDLEKLVILGHLGSAPTAITSASSDRRIKAVIALNLWHKLPANIVTAGIPCPLLVFQPDQSVLVEHHQEKLVSNTKVAYLFSARGTMLFDHLDLAKLCPVVMKIFGLSSCKIFHRKPQQVKEREKPVERSMEGGVSSITQKYMREFLDKHVKFKQESVMSFGYLSPASKRRSMIGAETSPYSSPVKSKKEQLPLTSGFMRMLNDEEEMIKASKPLPFQAKPNTPLLDGLAGYEGITLERKGWQ